MKSEKTQFDVVKLEELKKILPDQVPDGNDGHKNNQKKNNKKDKQRVAETTKLK
jgi:hypothetical protein